MANGDCQPLRPNRDLQLPLLRVLAAAEPAAEPAAKLDMEPSDEDPDDVDEDDLFGEESDPME